MVGRTIVTALFSLLVSTQAHAFCRDDLKDIKPRIEHMKAVSKGRYELANLWYNKAEKAEPGSETECINLLAKARKALSDPWPEVNNCLGPNAYLPQCQYGAATAAPVFMPPPGLGFGGGAGGGGGGTGGNNGGTGGNNGGGTPKV